jgi:DNA polymerase-3 subunit epsilon
MNRMVEKYSLCQKLSGLYPSDASCFHYEIGACKGACIGKESPDLYNQRAMKVISGNNLTVSNMLIIDAGRNGEERSVVKVENGKYAGFGYFTASYAEHDQGIIHSCVHEYPDNLEVQQIIKQYLGNYKVDRVIRY